VDEAARIITDTIDTDANIIFGATINEEYDWEIKITVVATGFDEESNSNYAAAEWRVTLKSSPFWKRPVTDSRITKSIDKPAIDRWFWWWEDLDVPTFLRRKM
jgi:cell division protein FtsZ